MADERNYCQGLDCKKECPYAKNPDLAKMRDSLKSELYEPYKGLLKSVSDYQKSKTRIRERNVAKCTFCAQWGKNFPTERHKGILFVGRAPNGWTCREVADIGKIFGEVKYDDRAFDRCDQMKWVEKRWGATDGKKPNTKRSLFWQVIKSVSEHFYPDKWWSYVAWSNLCKMSPKEGNPGIGLIEAQFNYCVDILKKELDILSPQIVVLITAQWDNEKHDTWGRHWVGRFFRILNKELNNSDESPKSIKREGDKFEESINDDLVMKMYQIGDNFFILCPRPEVCNKRKKFTEKLISLISDYIN